MTSDKSESGAEVEEYNPKPAEMEERADDDLRTMIWSTLQKLKAPSAFAFSATDSFLPNPGLLLPNHGIFRLPLSSDDAKKIIAEASQSPVGKGEETVIDTTVRKCWELSPNQFSLQNSDWNKAMGTILESVCTGLGMKNAIGKVSVQINKLLLYEPGAFFKPHKDSEKTQGMFATLVVCLPSPHEGGKLVLTHDNEKYEFDSASSSSFSTSYAAWYSDITHEVLPVTSGYRLMLTYNLIRQTNFVMPTYKFGHEYVQRLAELLVEYNLALEKQEKKLPPILLHKLKHKYTQASLQIQSLKSHDLAQVQTLAQLAAQLGFDIYLATLQLEVQTDEECDDYEEREHHLKKIVELDGKLVAESFNYPLGALIDPKPQDAGKADEVYRQGWTGNEGRPVTHWYRDTVVVLVPPSKRIPFVFKFSLNSDVIEPLFSKLMQEFSKDPAQKPKLEQLCRWTLKQGPSKRSWVSSKFTESVQFQQAATTALELGRFDLFDVACQKTDDKIMLSNARLLGSWTAKNGLAALSDRLMKGVISASSVAQKVEFLESVAEGFKAVLQEPSSPERISFKQWLDEAVFTALGEPTTRADGISLAKLCKTMDWSFFESKVSPVILNAVTKVKVTFINELMSALRQEFVKEQRAFIEMIIHKLWKEFIFESIQLWPVLKDNRDELNIQDVIYIVENSIKILSSDYLEATIIPSMLKAVPVASKEFSQEVFVPLVQAILKNEISGFKLPTGDAFPPTLHKCLVQALLTKYLIVNVGLEPEAPKNWSLPARSCKCKDCSVVNIFLQDPVRQSLDFPCGKDRRKHLHQNFTNCYSRSSYDVVTIRGRNPNVWRITKHHRDYQTAKTTWESNTKAAVKTLKELKSDEPVKGRLESYLEPYYSVIMNASVKDLPDLDCLIATATQTGLKRGASEFEDGSAKRSKSNADPEL